MGEQFNDKTADERGGFLKATLAMIHDGVSGFRDEVIHHPIDLLRDGLYGAAVTVGVAASAPEVGLIMTGIGVGLAAKGIYDHAGEWFNAGLVLDDPSHHSQSDIDAAHETFKSIGRDTAELAAGALGGVVGLKAVGSIQTKLKTTIDDPRPPVDPLKERKIALKEPKSSVNSGGEGFDGGVVEPRPPLFPQSKKPDLASEGSKGIANSRDKGLGAAVVRDMVQAGWQPPAMPFSLRSPEEPQVLSTELGRSMSRWEGQLGDPTKENPPYYQRNPLDIISSHKFLPISAFERDRMISKLLNGSSALSSRTEK